MGKLFEKKSEGIHKVYKIFGIRFKFIDKIYVKNKLELLEERIERLSSIPLLARKQMFWAFEDKYKAKERIWYLSQKFYKKIGYFPNFKSPKSFNEKLNWMKLNYYNPVEKIAIDKYEFKNYIKEKLGEGYTIPLIGVYDDVNDIDFDSLPNQFAIKTTTNGAASGVEIVKDKSSLDIDGLKNKFSGLIQQWNSAYYGILASGYKEITPRIIIEEYMPIREGKALEYKMFCFYGEVKFCLVECDYFSKSPKRAFYDKNFDEVSFKIGAQEKISLESKPESYNKMIEIAEILSKDFPHVRVDFYDIKGKIYVGELTFTSGGAFSIINPRNWDYKMGEWLDLNKLNPEYVHILPEFKEKAKEFLDERFFND